MKKGHNSYKNERKRTNFTDNFRLTFMNGTQKKIYKNLKNSMNQDCLKETKY